MRLKALMVDVDGVIVVPRAGGWGVDLERDLGLSVAALQRHFFQPHWADVVLGRAGLHERLAPVLAEHAPHLTSQDLAAYWFAHDATLDHKLLDELAALRAGGLRIQLATVQEHLRAEHLWTDLGLRERFDDLHYSADYGCGKPDPAFFQAVARRTGHAPGELLLLDDKFANVQAARAAGWLGALWDGTESLATALAREGVELP
ncbi:HAD-IA family hydrolase [Phenylobacterium sp.]|uniref:HAD-IA family hydrolase n=1 Tax=Phenylobacterium sp. TaxID=1871053 RepID=UPI00261F9700|nr:HAD-IA family hydrolase [Phenylobacterium sp.]